MKKTGFIAIVGRPNVGKSTLLNSILGEKVAIVSSKPQTTRNRIIGIHTVGDDQYVFLDTPGIFKPRNTLGSFMVKTANSSMQDADAVILVIDAGKPVSEIANGVRAVPAEYINAEGNGVTEACARYLLPLMAGEAYPTYCGGIPKQLIL